MGVVSRFPPFLAIIPVKGLIKKEVRQGKFFEIDVDESNEIKAKEQVEEMCKKLLANLVIEDYTII